MRTNMELYRGQGFIDVRTRISGQTIMIKRWPAATRRRLLAITGLICGKETEMEQARLRLRYSGRIRR